MCCLLERVLEQEVLIVVKLSNLCHILHYDNKRLKEVH